MCANIGVPSAATFFCRWPRVQLPQLPVLSKMKSIEGAYRVYFAEVVAHCQLRQVEQLFLPLAKAGTIDWQVDTSPLDHAITVGLALAVVHLLLVVACRLCPVEKVLICHLAVKSCR